MTEKAEIKRYIAIVQLKSDSTTERLSRDVPQIIDFISRMSDGPKEQVFRSSDGLLFGYFFNSSAPSAVMRAEFEKCNGTANGDALLVFEAGELATGLGFSRAWTWLQHH